MARLTAEQGQEGHPGLAKVYCGREYQNAETGVASIDA